MDCPYWNGPSIVLFLKYSACDLRELVLRHTRVRAGELVVILRLTPALEDLVLTELAPTSITDVVVRALTPFPGSEPALPVLKRIVFAGVYLFSTDALLRMLESRTPSLAVVDLVFPDRQVGPVDGARFAVLQRSTEYLTLRCLDEQRRPARIKDQRQPPMWFDDLPQAIRPRRLLEFWEEQVDMFPEVMVFNIIDADTEDVKSRLQSYTEQMKTGHLELPVVDSFRIYFGYPTIWKKVVPRLTNFLLAAFPRNEFTDLAIITTGRSEIYNLEQSYCSKVKRESESIPNIVDWMLSQGNGPDLGTVYLTVIKSESTAIIATDPSALVIGQHLSGHFHRKFREDSTEADQELIVRKQRIDKWNAALSYLILDELRTVKMGCAIDKAVFHKFLGRHKCIRYSQLGKATRALCVQLQ
ncbi:hypothetical protein B0H17DRAFT_1202439 [Mycena rosella]|uniref:Uncharacterized protein n=1 Tax=Mycena rosella TaxID=1033263 RepID=A0AAD7GDB9_MYCRO|nr:hypothetical protein B0H17DRAFT_1202439 [Mycena rosella]